MGRQLKDLTLAELHALRRLIARLAPFARAAERAGVRSGGGDDIAVEIVVERGCASAHITLSEEVEYEQQAV